MTEWAAFAGLTAVVVTLLLALARASQRVVSGDGRAALSSETDGSRDGRTHGSVARGIESHALAEGTPRDGRVGRPPAGTGGRPELTTGTLLANVALTQGLFGGVLLVGAVFAGIPPSAFGVTADPWVGGLPAVALGVGFGLALWAANETTAAVADAVGSTYDEGVRGMLAPDSTRGWVVLLGGVLPVVAVVEEFVFRAAIIGIPSAGLGVSPWALAVVSTSAFAVGHGAQGRVGVAVTGGLGFVLAAGYILSGSLLVVAIAHYLVNALEFLVHEWLGFDRLV